MLERSQPFTSLPPVLKDNNYCSGAPASSLLVTVAITWRQHVLVQTFRQKLPEREYGVQEGAEALHALLRKPSWALIRLLCLTKAASTEPITIRVLCSNYMYYMQLCIIYKPFVSIPGCFWFQSSTPRKSCWEWHCGQIAESRWIIYGHASGICGMIKPRASTSYYL